MTRAHLFLAAIVSASVVNFGVSSAAFAAEPEPPEKALTVKPLQPATRYSGRTPIDLTNGIPFNNGTYGARNANYEKWASTPSLVPNVSEISYPFEEKADLVSGLRESSLFIETAIANWKSNTHLNKEEVKGYADAAVAKMQSMLDAFNQIIDKTSNASKTDWEKQQADARRSLVELRANYSSMHRNVR